MSTAALFPCTLQSPKTELPPWFVNAPLGLAQCQREGTITALNPALERMLGGKTATRSLFLAHLTHPHDHVQGERLLREVFEGERDSLQVDTKPVTGNGPCLRWTAWRVCGTNRDPDYVLALVEFAPESPEATNHGAEQRLRQAERLESVGRLAGGVAHDFNNLLTGILLYCDLLLANLEPCHRVRKYASEIRNAGMQATGLVRQLLAVARPTNSEPRLLSLNEIAEGMRNLLVRLIGENIELQLRLDPNLGLVRMDPTQAQQILLNLALNARDAMPGGGRITVETRNCQVQILADQIQADQPLTEPRRAPSAAPTLPCALIVVEDNGGGMDDNTRSHLFEAFFTTKPAGKGTGLGLATVHDIVTSNGGLIHFDSALACGTRVTVLLPLVPETALHSHLNAPEQNEGVLPALEKEMKTL